MTQIPTQRLAFRPHHHFFAFSAAFTISAYTIRRQRRKSFCFLPSLGSRSGQTLGVSSLFLLHNMFYTKIQRLLWDTRIDVCILIVKAGRPRASSVHSTRCNNELSNLSILHSIYSCGHQTTSPPPTTPSQTSSSSTPAPPAPPRPPPHPPSPTTLVSSQPG